MNISSKVTSGCDSKLIIYVTMEEIISNGIIWLSEGPMHTLIIGNLTDVCTNSVAKLHP